MPMRFKFIFEKFNMMRDCSVCCRLKIVGEKLGLSQFSSAEECFVAMDKDKGGTLSRKEIAVGLLKVLAEALTMSLIVYATLDLRSQDEVQHSQLLTARLKTEIW